MERRVQTLEEFEGEASRLARTLIPQESGATLITLSGELGAGKTAFTKAVAKTLGVTEVLTSPTFVLEKIYTLTKQPFQHLIHIDAYRLEEGTDLETLRLRELLQDPLNLILLEWPERVMDALPSPTRSVSIILESDGSRSISYG